MPLPVDERSSKGATKSIKRLNFLKLTEGRHILRLLSSLEDTKLSYTHWVRGTSLECPGQSICPICQNNQDILMAVDNEWEAAKKVRGFNPYQVRYYVNVLDRTPVKVSTTGVENKARLDGTYPMVCPESGEILSEIPESFSNTVKVLSGGKTLFNDLEALDLAVLDQNGSPIGIHNMDIVLMVKGSGRDRKVTVIPQEQRNDPVGINEEDLHDLDKALISFTPEEINDFIAGASLKDIFDARKLAQSISADAEDVGMVGARVDLEEEASEKLSDSIQDLLSKRAGS